MSRYPHKHHGGGCIVPEEPKTRPDKRRAQHGQFARARHKMHLQIIGKNRMTDEIGNQAETGRCNHHRHNRQAVQTVGEINRIGRPDNDEHAGQHKQGKPKGKRTSLKNGMA